MTLFDACFLFLYHILLHSSCLQQRFLLLLNVCFLFLYYILLHSSCLQQRLLLLLLKYGAWYLVDLGLRTQNI